MAKKRSTKAKAANLFERLAREARVSQSMRASYRETMTAAGVFDPSLVATSEEAYPPGVEFSESFLRLNERPTVVFTTTSRLADHVAIAARGEGIPFDSGFEIATLSSDQMLDVGYLLHLVHPPYSELGARALERTLELIQSPRSPRRVQQMNCSLILRGARRNHLAEPVAAA